MENDLFDPPETTTAELLPAVSPATSTPRDLSPLAIIDRAVDKGSDPEQLSKLMDLYERHERFTAERAFAEAMHACQLDMPKCVRNARNKQTGSDYADLENVQRIARPIYTKHGFSLCFGESDCPLPNHKRTTCDVTHVGGHSKERHLDLPVDGIGPKGNAIGGMNAVQGAISTTSYGQRRLLCMIFNITITGEDDDGQGALERINDDQAAMLEEWIETSGANRDRFLGAFEVEKLADLPAKKFNDALSALKRKHAQQR